MTKKLAIILFSVALLIVFLVWLFVESSKPLPGAKIADLGRGHVTLGEKVDYNSNPPTSGKHYDDWIRSGVYNEVKDDKNLVHSLEHGYVVMSYNCDVKVQSSKFAPSPKLWSVGDKVQNVYAHGVEEEEATSSGEATSSASLPESFRSEDCHKLVDLLISVYEKKGKKRLIVVPRPNLDTRIALTAWNYIDKFDAFDEQRITRFIDTHLNQGPEKTME